MKFVPLSEMEAFDAESGELNVVVETPRGSRNKYTYVAGHDLFELSKALPAGSSFPYDFGFIPSTRGDDGDPLDVLLLMEAPAYPGVLVRARLIGVIEAEQTEEGKTVHNDRLIAVPSKSQSYAAVKELPDLYEAVISEIEHFFVSYNAAAGKSFKVTGNGTAARALSLVKDGMKRYKKEKKGG